MLVRMDQLITSTLFFLLLLHATPKVALTELVPDNIAMPQDHAHRFVLPAPGLRHRPPQPSPPQIPPPQQNSGTPQLTEPLSTNDLDHFLPLGPGDGVARLSGLDVACNPDYMTVSLTFDNAFFGIVYAKGFYSDPGCIYVSEGGGGGGGGGREVEFRVVAGRCGVHLVEPRSEPPYLETVIVIQNQPGIQEVWDSARGVRCVFEDGLERARAMGSRRVSAALNVDLLDQKMVTFAAKTSASASLDVQVGRGPFARSASGMVRIGELMTMVVGVEGPSNTDLQVRECVARDGSGRASYQLTDKNGCVLDNRRKVVGPWQKTRDTGKGDMPVMAYSHFQAFKFPDENDVFLECEVDLCVEACPVCPEEETTQRRRRETSQRGRDEEEEEEEGGGGGLRRNRVEEEERGSRNVSLAAEGVKLARRLRVISPEDFSLLKDTPITLVTKDGDSSSGTKVKGIGGSVGDICFNAWTFAASLVAVVVVLVLSSSLTALVCVRVRTIPSTASTFPPDSSFHAFSTVSGKTG
ncbi:cuticlin-4-like [Eriocheir sinensis]|uniref:cuticlin-4-like n=1 Tax=Eriocheir sinensis TaxID=95602 RepID=UPI0021C9CA02|nr:cuticlin-4-like [Eriocheir sinensis]